LYRKAASIAYALNGGQPSQVTNLGSELTGCDMRASVKNETDQSHKVWKKMAPQVGLEPTTLRLHRILRFRVGVDYLIIFPRQARERCWALFGYYWFWLRNP